MDIFVKSHMETVFTCKMRVISLYLVLLACSTRYYVILATSLPDEFEEAHLALHSAILVQSLNTAYDIAVKQGAADPSENPPNNSYFCPTYTAN